MFHLNAAFFLLLGCLPAFAGPAVTVKPIHNPPGEIAYPRLVAGGSTTLRRRANEALSQREGDDRQQRLDCLAAIREAGQQPSRDSFDETITATYVSTHYLSVDVRQSYFCATAYPTEGAANPLTIDLATGNELDWKTLFKSHFLPRDEETEPSALSQLYQTRYAASDEQQDCKDVVSGGDPFSEGAILWLDAAKGGLVVQPDFPHVIAACARPIIFSPKDLAPYADPDFLRDLATAGTAAGCNAGAEDCPITLRMKPGKDTTTVKGVFRPKEDCCAYAFRARSGQVLTWSLTGPAARVKIRHPDGRIEGPVSHRIPLSEAGEYVLHASSDPTAGGALGRFAMTIGIR